MNEVAKNHWCVILHHASSSILEQRWLPEQMSDGAFMASLALLALEAERLRPAAILIDATQFQYRPGSAVMQWRNDCIIPRYGSAGIQKFALLSDGMVFRAEPRHRVAPEPLTPRNSQTESVAISDWGPLTAQPRHCRTL